MTKFIVGYIIDENIYR